MSVTVPLWNPKPAFAHNVDPTPSGGVKVRDGKLNIASMVCDIGWSSGSVALVQSRARLWKITRGAVGYSIGAVPGAGDLTLVDYGDHMSGASVGTTVFWSNGYERGIIEGDDDSRFWGMPRPNPVLTVAKLSGSMGQGRYLLAFTFIRADGYESAPSDYVAVDLLAGEELALSGLANGVPSNAVATNVYVTFPDGDVLRLLESVSAGTDTLRIWTINQLGMLLADFLEGDPPPAGIRCLTLAWGRIVGVVDNVVFWSGGDFERFKIDESFIQFSSRITGLGFLVDSLLIGTTTGVYRLSGGFPEEGNDGSSLTDVRGDIGGMVEGSLSIDPRSPNRLMWVSNGGKIFEAISGGTINQVADMELPDLRWIGCYAGIHPVTGVYVFNPVIEAVTGSISINLPTIIMAAP